MAAEQLARVHSGQEQYPRLTTMIPVMDLAGQDGLDVSLNCEIKVVSEFSGFDEALTAK